MTPLKITAGMVAAELRRLADALDKEPETEVTRPLCFFYPNTKEAMKTLARLLPRPYTKFATGTDENSDMGMDCGKAFDEPVWIRASIRRSYVCERVQVGTKVEPAYVLPARAEEVKVPEKVVPVYEYHCGSFLAPAEEEAQLEGAA